MQNFGVKSVYGQSSINGVGAGPSIIYSQFEQSKFEVEQEKLARIERIKQVRQQESHLSKVGVQDYTKQKQQEQQQRETEQKYQEYLQKKQQIERLQQLRQEEIERNGAAMRAAQEAEKARLDAELAKKKKAIQDQKNAKTRGGQALVKERRLMEEKKDLEEQIKQVERKRQVFEQEKSIAHEQAQKYQREALERSMAAAHQSSLQTDVSHISQLNSKVNQSTVQKASALDYTATRFHTALSGRSNTSVVINETLQAQAEKQAFERAKEAEQQQKLLKAQQENKNHLNQQKARDRGSKAIQQILAGKDKDVFEKEMKQAQIDEGLARIEEVRKNPELADEAQAGFSKTLVGQKKQKQKEKKLEAQFENLFLQPEKPESRLPPRQQKQNTIQTVQSESPVKQVNINTIQSQSYVQGSSLQYQSSGTNLEAQTLNHEQRFQQNPYIQHLQQYDSQYRNQESPAQQSVNPQFVLNQQSVASQQSSATHGQQPMQNNFFQEPLQQTQTNEMSSPGQMTDSYQSSTVKPEDNPHGLVMQQYMPFNQNGQNQARENMSIQPTPVFQSHQQNAPIPTFYNSQAESSSATEEFNAHPSAHCQSSTKKPSFQQSVATQGTENAGIQNQQIIAAQRAGSTLTQPHTISVHQQQESHQKIVEERDGLIQLNLNHPKGPQQDNREMRFKANQLAEKFLAENQHIMHGDGQAPANQRYTDSEDEQTESQISQSALMTSERKHGAKSGSKNHHDSESPSSDGGDYSSSALESSQNPASLMKQQHQQRSLQLDTHDSHNQPQSQIPSLIHDSYRVGSYQINQNQAIPIATSHAANFDNYLEANNQSQQNAGDISDSIATSKLADEFLQESTMTKEELQQFQQTNRQPTQSYGSPLRDESSVTLPSNYLLQSSVGQDPLQKSEIFGTDPNNQLLNSFLNSNPTNNPLTQAAQTLRSTGPYNQVGFYSAARPSHQAMSAAMSDELSYSVSDNMTASGGGFFNSNAAAQLGMSINNMPHSRQQSNEQLPGQEIRNVNTGGCRIEVMEGSESSGRQDLAEAFKARRQQRQSNSQSRPSAQTIQNPNQKSGKTKEELLAIRKAMLKPKARPSASVDGNAPPQNSNFVTADSKSGNPELMARLAKGERAEVDKKSMRQLTSKNYELLPEVKKKKEEDAKKEQFKERMKQVKELEEKRKELLRKKQK